MMTRRQLTLTLMTILLLGLLSAGVSRFDAWHNLVPAVKAQSVDEPLERNSIFDRVRTRVCTNGFAEGRYGYTFNGMVLTSAGVATTTAVGVLTVKADGTLIFADTQSLNGQISRRNFTGTYQLNPDCTGTAQFSTGLTGDFVLTDDGREIRVIITTPGTIISGQGKKM
jgi:hypothetical protein